ncbi:hypothetical protein D0869_06435 [Hortaea werneckii]|uniref:Uncharacterized protein n=1 Tax=Hortaea werneckii TaxID=91943 RepID=A0A3M6ZAY2_HORWE|nr:hypothetical protein KC324_g6193 [Hortaea werneckii]KAI7587544.1 hypothetical protein KC316_g4994 [Hortaea werneckii]RMX81936.1 hypothetical protein D0869_06435 [Hortaea werneckii]RMY12488.1 hypothetical protein D0868_02547 [Hortaea werneckii]
MKLTPFCAGLLASTGIASAEIYIDRLPGGVVNPVERGVTYHINYETTRFYKLELLLVRETEDGWAKVDDLFKKRVMPAGKGGYDFTVPETLATDFNYALWLNGDNWPLGGGGYANLTEYFGVTDAPEDQETVDAINAKLELV